LLKNPKFNLRGHALLLKLERYLAEHIEGFAGPIRIEPCGSRLNPTYVLHTPEKVYVMRARPRPHGKLKSQTHPIEREFRVHWALAGSVTPLAKRCCLCIDESVIGRAFYVVERV
jgi:aminoglycoside phosphotransferase (APT) family kinase protein